MAINLIIITGFDLPCLWMNVTIILYNSEYWSHSVLLRYNKCYILISIEIKQQEENLEYNKGTQHFRVLSYSYPRMKLKVTHPKKLQDSPILPPLSKALMSSQALSFIYDTWHLRSTHPLSNLKLNGPPTFPFLIHVT